MEPFSRRQYMAEGVAVAAASAGRLSGGGEPSVEVGTPAIGTIAESGTPADDQPLPTPVAGDPEADRASGTERGVGGTPTVFVGGGMVDWNGVAYEPVRDAIESARDG